MDVLCQLLMFSEDGFAGSVFPICLRDSLIYLFRKNKRWTWYEGLTHWLWASLPGTEKQIAFPFIPDHLEVVQSNFMLFLKDMGPCESSFTLFKVCQIARTLQEL